MLNTFLSLFFIITGLFGTFVAINTLQFRNLKLLGSGFFPTLVSVILVVCGIGLAISNYRNIKVKKNESLVDITILLKISRYIFLVILAVMLRNIFGLLLSLGLFVFVESIWIEKNSIKNSAIVAVLSIFFLFMIYSYFLNIPLPKGFLGF